MLSCKQATELCSQDLEHPLGVRQKMLLGAHLLMCSGCTNFRKQMKTLRQVMHAYADGRGVADTPPEEDLPG